ncbi:ABC-type multidrug transport system, ATPase and permease component [Rubidibacter lacunae KORDI 51-2]|uniref:ABC-type multidrug transport system, ATPase and permease component n=1 Tax=Rubidibacter lacunae KORDI 51-2 TaxID=582515 RepID=U5DK49_9CHRO|nr:ABC transporter ATP-binding protein [Rubidibacter lacunae]ERN41287.1 ABC-type multidrug transport system, ATPase and permease component [Rubidibacter lacunae KORDI 51-2]
MKRPLRDRPDTGHVNPRHPLRRLLRYGRAYRQQVWMASICSVLNKIFDLAPPALIGAAVDVVVQQDASLLARVGVRGTFAQLSTLALLSLIIWGLESAFEYAYERLWRGLAQKMQHQLRLDAYEHVQELELAYFEERSTGDLMAVLNDDINQLERFLDVGANDILQVLTTVVAIGGAFFVLAPQVAWWAMLPVPFVLWGSIAFQNRLAPRYAEVRDRASFLNARLANNLSGIATIKSFTAEDSELERLARDSDAYCQSNQRAIALSSAFVPLIRIVILIGFVATLLVGGLAAVDGQMAVGTYSVMVFLTQRLLWPLTSLGQTLDLYQRAMASTQRVLDVLDTPISIPSGQLALPVQTVCGEIDLRDVTFSYRDAQPVLEQFSLHVPAGKTIAIVGATGSGKTTLVKLLLRLYDVDAGTIALDGTDIRRLRLQDLRRAIGWVNQDVYMFHGTVLENIAYGSPEAGFDDVVAAAKMAEAHEFVSCLPKGYYTIVGERGQKLSGGQRQRLAIARAILRDPPVLILDEATSAVDNETEAAIQRSLERITRDRTTIAIAHRLSTVRNADCIYVMDRGKIVERGRHEELLAINGIYAGLWRVQTGLQTMEMDRKR